MSAKVWLVGAGPGDPGLITVKGLSCIRQADALVYDRLVCADLLAEAPVGCELINVGKRADHHPVPQEEINGILIRQAQLGRQVVRLKGGDPYVFGRGGEEAEALALLGIPFEVVPGITSAIGGLAYAGIPVTHRSHASAFHVITGHLQAGKAPLDWATLARLDGTLVFLMGMSQLEQVLDLAIGFLLKRPCQHGCHGCVHVVLQLLRRSKANSRIGIKKTERRQRVGQFAANPVVDGDRLGVFRRWNRFTGYGIECLVVGENDHAIAGQIQRILGHRLQDRQRCRIGRLRQMLNRRHLDARIRIRKLPDQCRIGRGVRTKRGDHQQQCKQGFEHDRFRQQVSMWPQLTEGVRGAEYAKLRSDSCAGRSRRKQASRSYR